MTDSMTSKQALAELIDRVKAGEWPQEDWRYMNAIFWPAECLRKTRNAKAACHGSLDAAIALHEAVLPSFYWAIDSEDQSVCVFDRLAKNAQVAKDPIISRAWLLTILQALHAQETEE